MRQNELYLARQARESMKPREGNQEPSSETKDLVVFDILRDSQCAECLEELWKGDFLFMEGGRPLCLGCADLDHLVYLPRGDAALTRRARKHSALSAVVVRFSRSRGRYERQGVLVEEPALNRAEEECRADAPERRAKRERDRLRRADEDHDLTLLMAEEILKLFPGCPPSEARAIAAHTSVRGSGRVGRTSAGRALEEAALTAAVTAAVRHKHTPYDRLLMRGYSRRDAREAIGGTVDRMLESWRCPAGGGNRG
jgi:hypothetical protein